MKNLKILFTVLLFILFPKLIYAQLSDNSKDTISSIKKNYYKDGVLAIETYYSGKIIDSLKTYYKNGNKKELFYYTNGIKNGDSYQFNIDGEKIVTWQFEKGILLKRTDHKIEFNKKNEERIKKTFIILTEANEQLKINPKNFKAFYQRAHARYALGNTTLALADFIRLEQMIVKKPKDKELPEKLIVDIYDCLGGLFSSVEMEQAAIHFRLKAIEAATQKERLYYNLGGYLYSIKSYDLAIYYLEKVLETWPRHSFSHWVLGGLYSDLNENKKAMEHINIAFNGEDGIYKYGIGNSEHDIRTIRGLLYHKLGDSKKGIQDLEEALKINKNNSFTMRNLGVIYYDLKEYDKACKLLQKSKELGYEKIFDRNDLQVYLDHSCEEKEHVFSIKNKSDLAFVYPNPAVDKVTIQNIEKENFNYQLFNYNNQLVLVGIADHKSIDVSKLSTGLYILTFRIDEKEYSLKIIKE